MTDSNMLDGVYRRLLDIIDRFRAQGLNRFVDLPEIIACGDQSAGKSSVLEAISGMHFPVKAGLCTRFATELVLRRGQETSPKVRITPGASRFDEVEKRELEDWRPDADIAKDGLKAVVDEATQAMEAATPRQFFDDTLRIELTGPAQPHLTIVDLPGLFRAASKEQSESDVKTVSNMVKKYMARPRSIILAVVSAKNEYVLQEVTQLAKKADPNGLRTMGLVTKPDTLDVGSEPEAKWAGILQNIEEPLRLGWHVLRNRNFQEAGSTLAQRDVVEKEFLSSGVWAAIDAQLCGASALKKRLSSVLMDQILSQLPSLVEDVERIMRDCADKVERLGPVRATRSEQLHYLLKVSEDFRSLASNAVDGNYADVAFFGNPKKRQGYPTRLRAVVVNRLLEFRDDMLSEGQSLRITDSDSGEAGRDDISAAPCMSRSSYLEKVSGQMKASRGRELPGLFNPLVVGDLFEQQSEPWKRIASALASDMLDVVQHTAQLIIQHITASDVFDEVFKVVRGRIDSLRVELDCEIAELLTSAARNTITYNLQLTQNVQRAQQERHKREIKRLIGKIFGVELFEDSNRKMSINPVQVVNALAQGLEPDMEVFGASIAVDYMEAYYKVAMERFIDDVSVLAIENRLVSKVPSLFQVSDFVDASDADVSRLAGETPESALERKQLVEKRVMLDAGLRDLKSLQKERQFASRHAAEEAATTTPEGADDVGKRPDTPTPKRPLAGFADRSPTLRDGDSGASSHGATSTTSSRHLAPGRTKGMIVEIERRNASRFADNTDDEEEEEEGRDGNVRSRSVDYEPDERYQVEERTGRPY